MPDITRYEDFVEHPRYGRGPSFTGLNPTTDYGGDTYINPHSPKSCRVANTAIAADLRRQVPATIAVTHYFDLERQCRDCGRKFIFFAAEQKHWYEELQFRLDSDCVRCVPCRKQQQGIARSRQQYEDLFHTPDRTADQTLRMAECCLHLIEHGAFGRGQTDRVRMLLNQLPRDHPTSASAQLLERVREIERRGRTGA